MIGHSIPYFLALWQEEKSAALPCGKVDRHRQLTIEEMGCHPTSPSCTAYQAHDPAGRQHGSFAIFAGSAYRSIRTHHLLAGLLMHPCLNSRSGSQCRHRGGRGRARGGRPPARTARGRPTATPEDTKGASVCRPYRINHNTLSCRLAVHHDTTPTHSPAYRTIPRHSGASARLHAFHCCCCARTRQSHPSGLIAGRLRPRPAGVLPLRFRRQSQRQLGKLLVERSPETADNRPNSHFLPGAAQPVNRLGFVPITACQRPACMVYQRTRNPASAAPDAVVLHRSYRPRSPYAESPSRKRTRRHPAQTLLHTAAIQRRTRDRRRSCPQATPIAADNQ